MDIIERLRAPAITHQASDSLPVLADKPHVVAVRFQLGRVGVRPIGGRVRSLLDSRDSVARHVLAGEDAGATRPADRNGSESVLEEGSARCEGVHVGRGNDRVAGVPYRIPSHVIEEEEEDVGLGRRIGRDCDRAGACDNQEQYVSKFRHLNLPPL